MEMKGDQVKIAMKDDGRGLSLNTIRQKTLDNELIQEGQILNDEKNAELIFLPGFLTADKLTDISGRGVGMDAVLGFDSKKRRRQCKSKYPSAKHGALYCEPLKAVNGVANASPIS